MVYVLLGTGFEEIEAITPVDVLRRCGAEVRTAGIGGLEITGAHGVAVRADCTVEEIDQAKLDMIVLPGGMGGVQAMLGSQAALEAVRLAHDGGKLVAAICAGPTVLGHLGLLRGRKATSYPGLEAQMGGADYQDGPAVVRDGRLITSRGPGTSAQFALALAEALCGEAAARKVAGDMLIG